MVATAIHAGHDLRSDLAALMQLDEPTRRREEDPYTDRIIAGLGTRVVVNRSRFEVDLNRPRERAVYVDPADAWGLTVWARPLPSEVREESLALHDAFYAALGTHLDGLVSQGSVLLLDVHSYNHRRAGPAQPPAPAAENPEVNVGTGALDRARWGAVVDQFIAEMSNEIVAGHRLDVQENVRFTGGYLSQWAAARYPDTVCTLSLEFKKVFMDEWTDAADDAHLLELARAVAVVTHRITPLVPAGDS